jgi:hypothetical protein
VLEIRRLKTPLAALMMLAGFFPYPSVHEELSGACRLAGIFHSPRFTHEK